MQDRAIPKLVDDPDEAQAELDAQGQELLESEVTIHADEVESLDDLDTLLEESTTLANAKKAKAQGKRLDTDMLDQLARAKLVEDMLAWQTIAFVKVVERVLCTCCGQTETRFHGIFKAMQHLRRPAERQLIKPHPSETREPLRQFVFASQTPECAFCTPLVDGIEVHEFPLLSSFLPALSRTPQVESALSLQAQVSDQLLSQLEQGESK